MKRFITFNLLIVTLLFVQGCVKINPDEIGVRTVNFGSDKGVVQHDFEPGYHRFLWPLDAWHRFPSTVQRIQFSDAAPLPGQARSRPLEVVSFDGDRVMLNAEVFYKIAEGQAHRVLQDSGGGERYREVVRSLSIDAARAVLGRLNTEEFYNPGARENIRAMARDYLKEALEPRGIILLDILLITIQFDPAYENLIKEKKIADQIVSLQISKARAAQERGKVDMIRQETTVKLAALERQTESMITQMKAKTDYEVATLSAEAAKYASQKRADADLFQQRQLAEGTRLLKMAEAEGTERLNQAMVGRGGQNLAALEAARNLQIPNVVFSSVGIDWFNPHEMARKLGAEERISSESQTADIGWELQ